MSPLELGLGNLDIGHWLIATFIAIVSLVLTNLLPTQFKETLVFWRKDHPLPGSRAFTKVCVGDSRVDFQLLKQRYGEFPSEPEAQNRLWYRIYKGHREEPSVADALKSYLLFRDLSSISFLLLVFFVPLSLFIFEVRTAVSVVFLLGLAVEYLVIALNARNSGNRLVCNALAEVSAA
ncbi:hypothetical protein [Salinibacter altiplanensis]|uniref:hypothetical protein n=1 Tax=Salinibacter altiplanensis TaxID=1803181 RepID=UPI00131A606B|nr:hypothetical protein [Salinibacter altiplanensis]